MKIEIANITQVDAIWPLVSPKFREAIEKHGDDFSPGEVWQMCRSGSAFLVIGHSGDQIRIAAVVRFDRWSNGPILRIIIAGGSDIDEWDTQMYDFIENLAKENGAKRVVAEGRKGWGRKYPKLKLLRCTYVMEIS